MDPPDELYAMRVFNYSIVYLMALFAFLLLDHWLLPWLQPLPAFELQPPRVTATQTTPGARCSISHSHSRSPFARRVPARPSHEPVAHRPAGWTPVQMPDWSGCVSLDSRVA